MWPRDVGVARATFDGPDTCSENFGGKFTGELMGIERVFSDAAPLYILCGFALGNRFCKNHYSNIKQLSTCLTLRLVLFLAPFALASCFFRRKYRLYLKIYDIYTDAAVKQAPLIVLGVSQIIPSQCIHEPVGFLLLQ